MRLVPAILVVAIGVDAYAYSGHYTQATVHEISQGVQRLASNISSNSSDTERPVPPRPVPDRTAPTS